MARPKKEVVENEVAENQNSSNNLLETLLKQNKDSHYNEVIPLNKHISTGSLILDSYVKIRSGGVVRLVAKTPESGKTSESFVLAENYMKEMDKAKALYVKAEGRLSPEMQARTGLKFVNTPQEWDYGTVFVLSCNVFEVVSEFIMKLSKQMHEEGEHLVIIIDSLDGLILKKDLEVKGVDGNQMVAGVPKLTKLLFRHLALPIAHYDILLLITGQYSADIKLDPYAPNVPRMGDSAGGSSVPHQCDYVFQYLPRYQGDYILEKPDEKPDPSKNKILGVYATVEIKKSASDTTGVKVKIPIRKGRVGSAIWIEKEVVDLALQFGVLTRKGAWYSFADVIVNEAKEAGIELKPLHQGLNNVFEYVEGNKEVFGWLLNKFKTLI
jgi:hypothetical protein